MYGASQKTQNQQKKQMEILSNEKKLLEQENKQLKKENQTLKAENNNLKQRLVPVFVLAATSSSYEYN